VFGRVIRKLPEPRQSSARPARSFFLGQGQELWVLVRLPREGVDAEEPKDVVDAEQVEDLVDVANADAPPVVIAFAEHVPLVQRDSPVLSPLLGERIDLEHLLRWRSPVPI